MGSCCESAALASACQAPVPEKDGFWVRFAVCLVLVGFIMMLGLGVNAAGEAGEPLTANAAEYPWIHGAMLVASSASVALLGAPLLRDAARAWLSLRFTMESLFVASASGAFVVSVTESFRGAGGPVYYDTVPLVMVIHALGKRLGKHSREKALAAVSALRGEFDVAVVLNRDGGRESKPVPKVTPFDRVLVAPGGAIPVDGVILEGRGYILEAAMTGEALPVSRGPGDVVSAGTYSEDGSFVVRPSAGARRLDGILEAVEAAKSAPSRYQERATRLVARFFPAVMVVSAATFLIFWLVRGELNEGICRSMSVLLVACPCALGLATPVAIWSGLHRLSRYGLVSRHADLIGRLATADRVVFDKTGTLSHSELALEAAVIAPGHAGASARFLALLRFVQSRVNHPVARTFSALECSAFELGRWVAADIILVPGAGLRARVTDDCGDSFTLVMGEASLAGEAAARELDGLFTSGASGLKRIYATLDGTPLAMIVLRESFREDAGDAFRLLREEGLKVSVLTGDPSLKGSELFGVAVEAGLSPAEKAARVAAWKASGETVIFVGDGLNDTAALAGADASIAMGGGVDLARGSAHGILVGERLDTLPQAVRLARRIDRTLRLNLYWAAAYNVVGISLAVAGALTPVRAALIMIASSSFVSWRAAKAAGMNDRD